MNDPHGSGTTTSWARPRTRRLRCWGEVWAFWAVKMRTGGFLTITNGFYPVLHPETANREPTSQNQTNVYMPYSVVDFQRINKSICADWVYLALTSIDRRDRPLGREGQQRGFGRGLVQRPCSCACRSTAPRRPPRTSGGAISPRSSPHQIKKARLRPQARRCGSAGQWRCSGLLRAASALAVATVLLRRPARPAVW